MRLLEVILALDICVFITFVIFRLLGIILWSIIWILAPIWIPVAIIAIIMLLARFIANDIL